MSKIKTVALSEETFENLEKIKAELDAGSFEETIKCLMKESKKIPKSMFGIDKSLKPFTSRDEKEFEGGRQ